MSNIPSMREAFIVSSKLPQGPLFRNYYHCECGESWEDVWNATCDDECSCGNTVSPEQSEDVLSEEDQ
jgi:hypothetical protein